ncbi:MAG TPA: branched-chain amino acid ABC transporter ATP-binding protein/permease [Solirubrobacterales bacterium]|nr:branched-chain amino acid ABC transporter ATP-binding protein/permease [Solirubrobacterales bacterium]
MTYYSDWINQILIFAIFAMSLNLLMGYAGQVSVAHAAFGGVGGYAAGYLSAHSGTPFLLAIVIGVAIAAVIGGIISLPALRLSQEYLVLLTLAAATILISIVTSVDIFGGALGLQGIQPAELFGKQLLLPEDWLVPLIVAAVLVYLVCWRLGESPYGRVLRGIREDEMVTRALGKNVFTYKVAAFAITAGMAGLAGALLAYYNGLAIPSQYGFSYAMAIIAMVILGGAGNLNGSVVGAIVVVGSEPFLQKVVDIAPDKASLIRLLLYGLLLVVVLLVRPQGIVPERLQRRRLLARLLRREEDDVPVATGQPPAAAAPSGPAASTNGAAPVGEAGEVVVEVSGLAKSFGGIQAVNGLDFELTAGQITGLIGPNGAGKTTVFNLLTGSIQPDAGTVVLRGEDITGRPPNRVAQKGMVRSFQDVRVYPRLSALQNVLMGIPDQPGEHALPLFLAPWRVVRGERQARRRALECLGFVGLADKAHESAGEMAFGEQKLVALARLLATDADILLLDEPASGIDTRWVDRMLEAIERLRTEGKIICIVEHNLHVVERIADRIFFMDGGKVAAKGTMEELRSQKHLVEAYFGVV